MCSRNTVRCISPYCDIGWNIKPPLKMAIPRVPIVNAEATPCDDEVVLRGSIRTVLAEICG